MEGTNIMNTRVNKMTKIAVLSALSIVFMLFIRFPIIPAAPFLEYEPGDVPAIIGTFIYGPVSGIIITTIVSILQALTVSNASGWIGAVMHLIATGTMVVTAGLIYRKFHSFKGAIAALVAGSLAMTAVMIPLNLFITPMFLNVPYEAVKSMILPAIVPFNLLKAAINSVITMLVYKSVGKVLRSQGHHELKSRQYE